MAVADAVAAEQTRHETEIQELLIETRKTNNEERTKALEALEQDHATRLEHEVARAHEEGKSEGLQEGAAVSFAFFNRKKNFHFFTFFDRKKTPTIKKKTDFADRHGLTFFF